MMERKKIIFFFCKINLKLKLNLEGYGNICDEELFGIVSPRSFFFFLFNNIGNFQRQIK